MVRHVVMWKLRGPTEAERHGQAQQVRAALLGMVGKIPGMSSLEVGVGTQYGEQPCDVVLMTTHDDWQALEAYAKHPAHEPVAKLIGDLRVERRVVDFEV